MVLGESGFSAARTALMNTSQMSLEMVNFFIGRVVRKTSWIWVTAVGNLVRLGRSVVVAEFTLSPF